jgi:hypothetical protein
LRGLADERRRAGLASRVVELSSAGDRTGASAELKQLLDEAPYETDSLLRQRGTGEQLRPVAEILTDLASDPRYGRPAANVLRWLDMPGPESEMPPAAKLQVQLPSSWFADYADPLREHSLFLRYLPELRARVDWHVPKVQVRAEEDLEPDGYRIWTDRELLDEGRVSPEARFGSDAALELLPDDLRSAATSDPDLALCSFPAVAVQERDTVADLITMPTEEVVARLVGDAAKRLAERPTSATSPGWTRLG